MGWNINYDQTAGAVQAPPPSAPPPVSAPSAPSGGFDWNKSLPGNSPATAPPPAQVGSTSPPGGGTTPAGAARPPAAAGGEISLPFEQLKVNAALAAANQAYLTAKLQQDSEQVAINKAIAEANRVYQEKSIELQTKQLGEQQTARLAQGAQQIAQLGTARASAFNTGMKEFEQSGVATRGRIAGLNALRAPLPASAYATMLGLDPNDPRVNAISQAAQAIGGATPQTSFGGGMASVPSTTNRSAVSNQAVSPLALNPAAPVAPGAPVAQVVQHYG